MLEQTKIIEINKEGWNKVAHYFFEGSYETLRYGPFTPEDDELNLFGEIRDSIILEVGCGSGHTLEFMAKQGARELWGVDFSSKQIETAKQVVSNIKIPIKFIEAPMEEINGLPSNYFDKAISIYALGWTVDLQKTLANIYYSLKSGGILVFSWEHPIHSAVEYKDEQLQFRRAYVDEGLEKHDSWKGVPIVMQNRKVSTFINELIKTGFIIDKVIEDSKIDENDTSNPQKWYSAAKARLIPSTLIIKSHKA